jgi:hypothetical protein
MVFENCRVPAENAFAVGDGDLVISKAASSRPFAVPLFGCLRGPGETVGAPILGADAVMHEEKAGGIVFLFDGF